MRCDVCLESVHLADVYDSDGTRVLCRWCYAAEVEERHLHVYVLGRSKCSTCGEVRPA